MSTVVPHLSVSRQIGELVFVSGQLPFGADRKIVSGGIQQQTQQCLVNLAAVLAQSGLTLGHVVKTTVWLTRTSDFVEFNQAYAKAFPGTPPARSTVRADLMIADALVEIEAIASKS